MPYGDAIWWTQYPWTTSGTSSYAPTWQYTGATYYTQPIYAPQKWEDPAPKIDLPESPMEWLRRRVVEITDLAYAEV